MDDKKARKKFKRSILFKYIGIFIVLLSIIPIGIEKSTFNIIITTILLLIGFYVMHQYKCPYCGYSFNYRIRAYSIKYCPNCGKEIN